MSINITKEEISQLDQAGINELFIFCCKSGELRTIKYLFGSSNVSLRPDLDFAEDFYNGLTYASANGHLNIVKYLLFEKKGEKASFDNFYQDYLSLTCEGKHFHIMDYLLEHKIFDPERAFVNTHQYLQEPNELTRYLVMNCDIPISSNVQEIMNKAPMIRAMFESRELNKELSKNLSVSNSEDKKFKL